MAENRELDREVKCAACGGAYRRTAKKPTYCSRSCYVASRWVDRTCVRCGVGFQARRIYVNRGQMQYCSRTCSDLVKRKRPERSFNGVSYRLNSVTGYYTATGGALMHRDVWTATNGPIPPRHVVHHRDRDKANNSLPNLQLMEWGRHTAEHRHDEGRRTRRRSQCENCERPACARSLCTMHYQRARAAERKQWN